MSYESSLKRPLNAGHCAERVYGVNMVSKSQCARKAGFGRDGKYCKQHALRHPSDEEKAAIKPIYLFRVEKKFNPAITRVQVQGMTGKTILNLNGSREARDGEYHRFFATFAEAKEFLLMKALSSLSHAEAQVLASKATIEKYQAMEEPEWDLQKGTE